MSADDRRTAAVVAAAIERHLRARPSRSRDAAARPAEVGPGSSHRRFPSTRVSTDPAEGRCVIEPAVACEHSGYCRSQGY